MFDIEKYIKAGKKYYIYGTREIGDYIFHRIEERLGEEAILGFLETSPLLIECNGKRVYALSQVSGLVCDDDTFFLLAAANAFEDMRQNLIKRGIGEDKIIALTELYPYFKNIRLYGGELKKVCFWPPIKQSDEDIRKKISWFLPDKVEVTVWCEKAVENSFNLNVSIGNLENIDAVFSESDAIYVWNMTSISDMLDKYTDKVYVVDREFYKYVETNNYSSLYYNVLSLSEKESYLNHSKEVFRRLLSENKMKRANIFCSGPSVEEIYGKKIPDGISMIANSMVKDKEFLEQIQPKILFFADMNFYVSPSDYCMKFFEDVLEAVEKYDMYIVVFNYRMPLVLQHFPQLKDRTIGIPFGARTFNFPTVDNFCTKSTSNILTELILPIASALCDEIGIAGCTGRSPEEKSYYWRHNPNTQYLDLMQSVFDMYPSVFRDQRYDNYFAVHCKTVEEIIRYGENLGKKYINLTTSFIPALERRMNRV